MAQTFKALRQLLLVLGILMIISVSLVSEGAEVIHHNLKVRLIPLLNKMEVQAELVLPLSSGKKMSFLLHKNLNLVSLSSDDSVRLLQSAGKDDLYNLWGLQLGPKDQSVLLSYQGQLNHSITNEGSEGFISDQGVLLWGASYWYPTFLGYQATFDLEVNGPINWTYVNQGQLISKSKTTAELITQYSEKRPQEEIYLIAGQYKTYETKSKSGLPIRVLLRGDGEDLAQSYLALLPDYIDHYSRLLGPYPYSHFSVVENWWETGFGMPAFTLLGPTVIRLPFILSSSLPHEVLHNWFGNSVYVDYEKGNWAEGLTTYLSDYWQQEVLGLAKDYRLSQLISYTDFAQNGQDFPLIEFRGRHNSATQAVGYGKSMMIFHMLRNQLGQTHFQLALQDFYLSHTYQKATWSDLQKSFEKFSNTSLQRFFDQWLLRAGAPQLRLLSAERSQWLSGIFSVEVSLHQAQAEPYDLMIPVRWTFQNGSTAWTKIQFQKKQQTFHFTFAEPPTLVEIDPEFEVFRALAPEERPASLSQIFGASTAQVFYSHDSKDMLAVVESWSEKFNLKLQTQEVVNELVYTKSEPLVLIGDSELFFDFFRRHLGSNHELKRLPQSIELFGKSYSKKNHSFVVTATSVINPGQTITWILSDGVSDLKRWGNRLTHYSKYGTLVFEKDRNILKTSLTPIGSPLRREPKVVSDFLSEVD